MGLTDKPASAQSFTAYIRDRGRKAGFTEDVTFYSLRRRTANDLTAALGRETARAVMNHDAAGKTLEEDYLEIVPQTDRGAIALGEQPRPLKSISPEKDLARTALPHEVRYRIFGPGRPAFNEPHYGCLMARCHGVPPIKPSVFRVHFSSLVKHGCSLLLHVTYMVQGMFSPWKITLGILKVGRPVMYHEVR